MLGRDTPGPLGNSHFEVVGASTTSIESPCPTSSSSLTRNFRKSTRSSKTSSESTRNAETCDPGVSCSACEALDLNVGRGPCVLMSFRSSRRAYHRVNRPERPPRPSGPSFLDPRACSLRRRPRPSPSPSVHRLSRLRCVYMVRKGPFDGSKDGLKGMTSAYSRGSKRTSETMGCGASVAPPAAALPRRRKKRQSQSELPNCFDVPPALARATRL